MKQWIADGAGAERLEPVADRAVRRLNRRLRAQMCNGIGAVLRRCQGADVVVAGMEACIGPDQDEDDQRNGDRAAVHTSAYGP